MGSRFRPSRRMKRDLLAATVRDRELLGERIALKARALAPVGEEPRPLRYRDRFDVVVEGTSVIVGNRAPHAHLIEWGTVDQAPRGVMSQAVRAVGLELKPSRKSSSTRSGGS